VKNNTDKFMEIINSIFAEIERTRLRLRIKAGMEYALRQGRYIFRAPIGYKYSSNGSLKGKSTLIHSQDAKFIRQIFKELANGVDSPYNIYRKYKNKGFKCTKTQFYNIIKNPMYKGTISIKTNDDCIKFVKGNHKPIIHPNIFDKVQKIIINRLKRITNRD
jgi:DNA invertase Pin-like site-specific DNA recombinase